jgi:hypothetical protein
MATTTNYSFPTPDDTALVKDGASAIRSLGTAVDTQMFTNAGAAINKTIVDAKGDLIAATAADTVARLAIGANATVLTADSTEATGMKWATPAGGAVTFTLLNSGGTALSGSSTVTVSGLSGYDILKVLVVGARVGVDSGLNFRINTDSTSKYNQVGQQLASLNSYDISQFTLTSQAPDASTLATGLYFGDANRTGSGVFTIEAANSTAGVKPFNLFFGTGAHAYAERYWSNGFYSGTSVVSSISVLGSANFNAGTVYVYGGK